MSDWRGRISGMSREVALSAMDGLLHGRKAHYASTELTTGKRCYALAREEKVGDPGSLRTALGDADYLERLWEPNQRAAREFATQVHQLAGKETVVINPCPLQVPGWSQEEYLDFWGEVLRTRVKCVYFNDNWEYSNGCTFEFAVALETGLPTFNREGRPLSGRTAAELVRAAVSKLRAEGFQVEALEANLRRMERGGRGE